MVDEAVVRIVVEGGRPPEHPGEVPASPQTPPRVDLPRPQPPVQPEAPASPWRGVLDVLNTFRGTLGGMFGKLPGAVLDLVAAFDKLKSSTDALNDAQRRRPAEPPLPPGVPPSYPEKFKPTLPTLDAIPVPPYGKDAGKGPPPLPPGLPQPSNLPPPNSIFRPGGELQPPSLPPISANARVFSPLDALPVSKPPSGLTAPNYAPPAIPNLAGGAGSLAGAVQAFAAAGPVIYAAAQAVDFLRGAAIKGAAALFSIGDYVTPENDPSVFVGKFGQDLKGASESLRYVSPVLSVFAGVAGEATGALSRFMHALDGFVSRYEKFSPTIAGAQAQAEIAQVLGDLRRAQLAAPSLQAYIAARTNLQQSIEDAKIRMLEQITPAVIAGMRIIERVVPIIENIVGNTTTMAEILPFVGDELVKIRRGIDKDTVGDPKDYDATELIRRGYIEPGFGLDPRTGRPRGVFTPRL